MEPNLESVELDPSIRLAYEAAKYSQTITPILKEELKLTILNRRFKSGKGDINMDERKPAIKRELTDEEVTRRMRRKEQNRRAAERCRVKKKKLNDQLAIDYVNEQRKSSKLAEEVELLKRDKDMLEKILKEHAFTCAVTPSPSYDNNTTFFNNGPYTCPTPCIPNEMPGTFIRDTSTPLCDPFDDLFPMNQEQDNLMYPGVPLSNETKGTTPTCTLSTEEFPEVQIPDDFSDFTPVSPDMVLGRQSISDYLDEELLNN